MRRNEGGVEGGATPPNGLRLNLRQRQGSQLVGQGSWGPGHPGDHLVGKQGLPTTLRVNWQAKKTRWMWELSSAGNSIELPCFFSSLSDSVWCCQRKKESPKLKEPEIVSLSYWFTAMWWSHMIQGWDGRGWEPSQGGGKPQMEWCNRERPENSITGHHHRLNPNRLRLHRDPLLRINQAPR